MKALPVVEHRRTSPRTPKSATASPRSPKHVDVPPHKLGRPVTFDLTFNETEHANATLTDLRAAVCEVTGKEPVRVHHNGKPLVWTLQSLADAGIGLSCVLEIWFAPEPGRPTCGVLCVVAAFMSAGQSSVQSDFCCCRKIAIKLSLPLVPVQCHLLTVGVRLSQWQRMQPVWMLVRLLLVFPALAPLRPTKALSMCPNDLSQACSVLSCAIQTTTIVYARH
jgi:hypothetical protein